MKKTYIIIVLILIALGLWFFMGRGNKLEAPTVEEKQDIGQTTNSADLESTNSESSEVKEFTISGKNFSFTPNLITVKKGDKVKITFNNTEGFHDFKIDEFGVATKQAKSPDTEVLEFTADKVGSFEYYCSVGSHRSMGMKGTLQVE
jgi:cytochrome c oxidase subunit 2